MTADERDHVEWLEAQLEWADRLMSTLMARPKPPLWARFDDSEARTADRLLDVARRALNEIALSSSNGVAAGVAKEALNVIGLP